MKFITRIATINLITLIASLGNVEHCLAVADCLILNGRHIIASE